MKKDFKMAILIPSLIKTAPNMIALTLYRYAKARYGDVSLYYLDPVVNSGKEFIDATDAIHLTDKNILKEFDIVHSHGLRPDIVNFFYTKKIKLSTIHSFITKDLTEKYGIKGFVFSKIWLFFLAKFNSCAVMSNYASNYYSKISCCVIPNGIDKSSFCKSDEYFSLQQIIHEKKQQNKIVVGTVAALEKIKGISQLIDLAANNPDINIVIIGDGSQREFFKNYIKRLDLEKQVILYGKVKNGAIYSSLFDVYVQPSLSEGFGLAVIEAILNKTPVVCSDIPVFKEMFNSNEVEFFSINDISSLYYAIVKAYKYSDNRIDMAYKKVADEYSESGMVKKYMEWYEKFI